MINITNLVVYRKNNEQISFFHDEIKQYFPSVKNYILYTDQTRDSLAYQQMKEDISDKEAIVLMDSINDLSLDPITQIHEIDWFLTQSISCIFFTYTTMLEHPENNQEHLRLLKDYLMSTCQKKKVLPFNQVIRKKRIDYPEQWGYLFDKWEKKEITARYFMKECGLKRGTFYHMVADYKEQTGSMKRIVNIT